MKTKVGKASRDVRLKVALVETCRTQRRAALETRIGEVRLSAIVRGHGAPATPAEQERLVAYLNRVRATLNLPRLDAADLFSADGPSDEQRTA